MFETSSERNTFVQLIVLNVVNNLFTVKLSIPDFAGGKAKTRGHPINKDHPMKRLVGHICGSCYEVKYIVT